ncbi:MAG: hypothetical protein KGL44_12260 [Sphingomonadales bacterium]|nr:hypothetical protein [Sphingomonadales bacterium]
MAALAGSLIAGTFAPFASAREIQPGLLEITGNDARMASAVIGMLTAVPVGTGREVTCYMSSLCSVCQAFMHDYPTLAVPEIAMRYVPTILAEHESGAVERVLARPDVPTFRQFMARRFAEVPPVPFDPKVTVRDVPTTPAQRYSRHSLLIAALTLLFRRNGSPDLPEGTPRFLFTSATGAAYMVVGTPPPEMFRDIARLK